MSSPYCEIVHPDDTIVALSSAAGPGERAVVRISGPSARTVLTSVFGTFEPRRNRVIAGELRLSGVHSTLPATLYFFPAPHSYTGQDLAELHTVSSPPLIERLIADLLHTGARAAGPGEFTQRAFLAGKLDLTRAEAVQAVIASRHQDDLQTALQQLAGNVARPLDALRDDLLNLLADVEAALDFVEEDIEFVTPAATLQRLAGALGQLTNLRRQLEARTVSGRPVRVVLAGAPNAGKSSLFNALIGKEQAIVSPLPGTTRDYLTALLDLDSVKIELIDTAGRWKTSDSIDQAAQHLARDQADRADLMLWCAEPGQPFPPSAELVRVRTKSDSHNLTDGIRVSTITLEGLGELRRQIAQAVRELATSPLAPSASRCTHHVDAAIEALRRAHEHVLNSDPAELLALELRKALDQIGEMVGAVYTNDLLDRIFSRFCIGK